MVQSNPLLSANPQAREMLQNPQLRAMLQNPQFLSQMMNPNTIAAIAQYQNALAQLQSTGLFGAFGYLASPEEKKKNFFSL
jgi:hypothetical protein